MIPYFVKVYYIFRPCIPRKIQIFLRRRLSKFQRKLHKDHWPIDLTSAKQPVGWKGWPNDKQFAFIISHDVDTRKGYNDAIKLAKLEEQLGFRSTFYFVPERYGEISLDIINELKRRGFGIGIHGLKHDGKLYFSRNTFYKRAVRINNYLKKWNSKGFSSPSMHHCLEWLEALQIDYSISTFDTDPFEPQSDGISTIFPKYVDYKSNRKNGHIELPYTMPQDSTLFLILQEKNIDIWKQKLNWIAGKGGMAMVKTHPDYMVFDKKSNNSSMYPVSRYLELLTYLSDKYRGKYYHGTALDVSEYLKKTGIY